MSLEIIVVGAGIAGLCAAISLREAGHRVKVFEKSQFLGEVGAALLLAPNGTRVLSHLNFDFENAKADEVTCWEVLNGMTFDVMEQTKILNAEERYGAKWFRVHRSGLHGEFVRLVKSKKEGKPDTELFLGAPVKSVDAEKGSIELQDGRKFTADLVVIADGVHSITRSAVVDEQASKPVFSGMNAFRFLIPTKLLEHDEKFIGMMKIKGNGATLFVDIMDKDSACHLTWYNCQRGTVQNFVGIHRDVEKSSTDLKTRMLAEFSRFHPDIVHIIGVAPEVTDWPLYIHQPLPTWVCGKTVLIGDAAHPMLPFAGQGANQAIEDGGALGVLLGDMTSVEDLPTRLAMFEKVRRLRASRVQILSNVRLGQEKLMEAEVKKYVDFPGQAVPTTFHERYAHDFGFDVYEKSKEALKELK